MTGRDERWLSESLSDAAPPPPTPSDLLAGIASVRRATRRRRSIVGVIASAFVVACVTVAVPAFDRDSGRGVDTPVAPSNTVGVSEGPTDGQTACRAPDDYNMERPATDDNLLAHPTEARLCAVDDGSGPVLQAPADPLVNDVEDLLSIINSQVPDPPIDGRYVCAGTGGMAYAIEFGYANGSTRTFEADTGTGCGTIGAPLYQAFTRLLRNQRDTLTPPYPHAKAECPTPLTPTGSMMGNFSDAVSMVACVTDHAEGTWSQEVNMSSDDLRILVEDAKAEIRDGSGWGECADDETSILLRGVTAWGDSVSQWSYSCRLFSGVWSPSDKGAAVLDRLIGPTTAR
jgi:hypothetical protein